MDEEINGLFLITGGEQIGLLAGLLLAFLMLNIVNRCFPKTKRIRH